MKYLNKLASSTALEQMLYIKKKSPNPEEMQVAKNLFKAMPQNPDLVRKLEVNVAKKHNQVRNIVNALWSKV